MIGSLLLYAGAAVVVAVVSVVVVVAAVAVNGVCLIVFVYSFILCHYNSAGCLTTIEFVSKKK